MSVKNVISPVILNLFQDPNAWNIRSRNKFGMTPDADDPDFLKEPLLT